MKGRSQLKMLEVELVLTLLYTVRQLSAVVPNLRVMSLQEVTRDKSEGWLMGEGKSSIRHICILISYFFVKYWII